MRGFPWSVARIALAAYRPPCIAAGATPGRGLPSCSSVGEVADDEDLGVRRGCVRSGSTRTRPERSSGTPRVLASGEPWTPAAQRTVRAAMSPASVSTPSASIAVTRVPVRTSTPRRFELLAGRRREVLGVAGQDPGAGLEEDHPRPGRVEPVELAGQVVAGDLGEGPGQLDAGRPAADDDERGPLATPPRVGLALGRLVGEEDPPADRRRVLDRLQARGELGLPLVVAEVAVGRPGGDDQVVVMELAVGEPDRPVRDVDRLDLAEQDLDVVDPRKIRRIGEAMLAGFRAAVAT